MSEEKKARKAERKEKRRQEEQKERRSMALYTAAAIVVVVAAVAAMFWRSGVLQRSMTALDVNGTKYTAADVQYYYNSIYDDQAQYYLFDTGASVKKQVYDESTGQTWYDYLIDLSVQQLTRNTALAQQAREEGYTLSAEAQAALDATIAQLETAWIGYGVYTSRDAFIRANFGANMTYDRLVSLIELEYLASDYARTKVEAIEHSDADYTAYYQENANQLDTFTFSQITFRCSLPTTDENGNTIERTDAEKASQLEELKAEQKALAEEVQAKLNAGEKMEDLIEEYEDRLYSSSNGSRSTWSNLIYFSYGNWLIGSGRRAGDVTVIEDGSDTYYAYYVVRFDGRELDQEQTHDVRHLLIKAGENATINSEPTQAEYDEAEKKARELLDQWKAGEATEESFAALVAEYTEDTSSADSGGLYTNITSTSSYVDSFRSWAIDPARKAGDTGLVKSEYGWHIMYYVSTNEPIWKQNAIVALQNQDYEQLADSAARNWTVTRGAGLNFISA